MSSWNINGWTQNNQKLREHILTEHGSDIYCLIETKLDRRSSISCDGYQCIPHNRQVRHVNATTTSGGVAILIKSSLFDNFSFRVVDTAIDGILGVQITDKSTEFVILIYVCYLPPVNTTWVYDSNAFFAHLISELYMNNYADVTLLAGDFNARIGNGHDVDYSIDSDIPLRKSIENVKSGHGDQFLEFLNDTKLAIINGRVNPENDNFTFLSSRGQSCVDYMVVPHDCLSSVSYFNVDLASDLVNKYNAFRYIAHNSKVPDHSMLTVTLAVIHADNRHNAPTVTDAHCNVPNNNSTRKVYNFNNLNEHSLNSEMWRIAISDISDRLISNCSHQTQLDDIYNQLCSEIFKELDTNLGFRLLSKKSRKKYKSSKPYWNEELYRLWLSMNCKEKAFNKYKGKNRHCKTQLLKEFKDSQQIFDKSLRKSARKYNAKQIEDIEIASSKDPKTFWNQIKQLGPRTHKNIPIKVRTEAGYTMDPGEVAKIWGDEFNKLLNQSESNEQYDEAFYEIIVNERIRLENEMKNDNYENNFMLNDDISFHEIEAVSVRLKNKKSTGIDLIPNEVIKCKTVQLLLYRLFKTCFEKGMVPSTWQQSMIKPIPKGANKDPHVPLNYRGISLISCISKTYSALINNRIVKYCEMLGLFPDEQNGFRSNRSCEDHIFTLTSVLKNRIANKKSTFCAFIDLEKAFDWLNRDLLLYKLIEHNIDGNMYRTIKSMLSRTSSCVRISNELQSNWFKNNYGVRQGDCLSPTLFSLYINDLAKTIKEHGPKLMMDNILLNILLYADDMVLIAESEEDLQKLLDIMQQWCYKWRLKVNIEKSKVVHFRAPRKQRSNSTFNYGEHEIDIVPSYKYLGVIMDEFLKFNLCTKTLANAGGRALGAIISKFRHLKGVGYTTFSKLYESKVQSILEYGSGVWGYAKETNIEIVQHRAMRYFLGVHKFAPNAGIYGDMGWIKHSLSRYICMVRLWNRCLNMNVNRLTRKVFIWDLQTNQGWGKEIKSVFHKLGLINYFNNRIPCNTELVKEKIRSVMEEQWKEEIENKPKLRTYKLFKSEFQIEDYVYCNNRQKRSLTAQLRIGILPLRVETGRFSNLALNDRHCYMCPGQEVEDELHFICTCPLYDDLRNNLFTIALQKSPIFIRMDNVQKLVFLFQNVGRELSRFLVQAWGRRRSNLYI